MSKDAVGDYILQLYERRLVPEILDSAANDDTCSPDEFLLMVKFLNMDHMK